jgi:hypothetical protein
MMECNRTLQIRNNYGTTDTVTQEEPHNAGKSLGIMFAPSGCCFDELESLRGRGQEWANHVRSSILSRDGVWYSLQHMIMKTIEYPLLVTT